MKNTILLIALLISSACIDKDKKNKELNILFIGNSLTYYHDMPETLQKMLNESHPNINIHQSTFPGLSLSGHLTDIITAKTANGISTRKKKTGERTETEQKIGEKLWDLVILQTGTVSVLIPENRDIKVQAAITGLKELVSNKECTFILFNTWPSKGKYPKEYCYPSSFIDKGLVEGKYCSPLLSNLKQELEMINQSYEILAKKNNLVRTNHGSKYYEIRTNYPEIDLYEDSSHPNEKGSFLNACIFYQAITGIKASKLNFTGDLDPEVAKRLKQISGE